MVLDWAMWHDKRKGEDGPIEANCRRLHLHRHNCFHTTGIAETVFATGPKALTRLATPSACQAGWAARA